MLYDATQQERIHSLAAFHAGQATDCYQWLGAHVTTEQQVAGVRFTLWAPNARSVSLVLTVRTNSATNEKNNTSEQSRRCGMTRMHADDLWSVFTAGAKPGDHYHYEIVCADGSIVQKTDPYAFQMALRPDFQAVISSLDYKWQDEQWIRKRSHQNDRHRNDPLLIYEVHIGSWRNRGIATDHLYEQVAEQLVDYVAGMGFTHIELLPVHEHPFDGSWGYQVSGFYAPTSRYGEPRQLKKLIDRCHQSGIGVILDWVPGHFCVDDYGLRQFDGTSLYEPEHPHRAEKPRWGTRTFDYERPEVISFLLSNAYYWLEEYHIDGLRMDAVASMMDWNHDQPFDRLMQHEDGGSDNYAAIAFLRQLNDRITQEKPYVMLSAEDSSATALMTADVAQGGMGFHYKWNMGWMNDTLRYMKVPFRIREHYHRYLTFSLVYAFDERFVLPLSHDEVVHGKYALLMKAPGTMEQKFAQLRLLYSYFLCHPGKKLLFMGGEFAQQTEWSHMRELSWDLLEQPEHGAHQQFIRHVNWLYRQEPALWEKDHDQEGFEWIDADLAQQSLLIFKRRAGQAVDDLWIICNFSDCDQEIRFNTTAHRFDVLVNTAEMLVATQQQQAESMPASIHCGGGVCALTIAACSMMMLKQGKGE